MLSLADLCQSDPDDLPDEPECNLQRNMQATKSLPVAPTRMRLENMHNNLSGAELLLSAMSSFDEQSVPCASSMPIVHLQRQVLVPPLPTSTAVHFAALSPRAALSPGAAADAMRSGLAKHFAQQREQPSPPRHPAVAAAAVAAVEAEAARDETFDAFVPVPKKKHCQGNGNQRPMFVEGHDFFPTCTPEFTAYKQKARRRATLRFIEKKRRQKAAAANPAGRYASRTKIANSRPRVKGRFVKTVELVRAGVFAAGENRKPGT